MSFKVVEKKNKNAVHCISDSRERAEHWIKVTAPIYIKREYFTDKTLTVDSFEILPKEEEKNEIN